MAAPFLPNMPTTNLAQLAANANRQLDASLAQVVAGSIIVVVASSTASVVSYVGLRGLFSGPYPSTMI